jgi:hypothetical protein
MGHRRSPMGYRSLVAIVGAALLAAGPVAGSPAVGAAPPAIHGVVRLDQVGYAIGEAKRAFLLAEAPVGTPRFTVVDGARRTVLSGRVGRRTGGWNGRYRAVHRIDFSALRRPGRYRIVVDGLAAASPAFRVATRHDLFGKLVDDTVRFFQVQRDGAQVPRRLDRRPSHLTDRHATVYATRCSRATAATCLRRRSGRSAARSMSRVAGSTPATSSSSPTRPPTRWPSCCSSSAACTARTMPWPPRPAMACGGWTRSGTSATRSCTPRSGSAPGASGSGSSATTTCGGCPRPTTRCGCGRATTSTSSSTARCSAPPRRARGSAPTWPAVSPPPSPSAPRWRPGATTSGRGRCCERRPRSSPWPGPPASASS